MLYTKFVHEYARMHVIRIRAKHMARHTDAYGHVQDTIRRHAGLHTITRGSAQHTRHGMQPRSGAGAGQRLDQPQSRHDTIRSDQARDTRNRHLVTHTIRYDQDQGRSDMRHTGQATGHAYDTHVNALRMARQWHATTRHGTAAHGTDRPDQDTAQRSTYTRSQVMPEPVRHPT